MDKFVFVNSLVQDAKDLKGLIFCLDNNASKEFLKSQASAIAKNIQDNVLGFVEETE